MAIGSVNVNNANNKEVLIEFNNYISSNLNDDNKMVLELPVGTVYKFEEHLYAQTSYTTPILINSPATGYIKLKPGVITTKQLSETLGKVWNYVGLTSNIFYDLVYNGNIWVAGTKNGILYSNDGVNWNNSNINIGYVPICKYHDGIWVASGYDVGIYYSSDGKNWTQAIDIINMNIRFNDINYDNNIWIAGGSAGLYYSADGMNWIECNNDVDWSQVDTRNEVNSIHYVNGEWIVRYKSHVSIGESSSKIYNKILYSTDNGINWIIDDMKITELCMNVNDAWFDLVERRYSMDGITWSYYSSVPDNGWFSNISYHNNLFVASGKALYYSNDGLIWNLSNITSGKFSTEIVYANNIWVVCDNSDNNGIVYYSTDGISWTQSNLVLNGEWGTVKCYYENGIWIVSRGYGTTYTQSGTTGIWYSTDGMNWIQTNIPEDFIESCNYNNNTWIICAGSIMYHSTDGMMWTAIQIEASLDWIRYYNNMWIGGGGKGILYSPDCINWTQSNIKNGYFDDCYYDDDIFLSSCVKSDEENNGLSEVWYSTDGINWIFGSYINSAIQFIQYGDGLWITGGWGDDGLWYSTDAMSWIQSNITSGSFVNCYYDNNTWIALGIDDGLYYSSDGITWNHSNITSGDFYEFCCYGDGIWNVWGEINGDPILYYSTDGINWIYNPMGDDYVITIVGYNNGMWVGCGSNGLWYSTDAMNWIQSNITEYQSYNCYCANGIWVASSEPDDDEDIMLFYSTDGMSWKSYNIGDRYIMNFYYADNKLIGFDNRGGIYISV